MRSFDAWEAVGSKWTVAEDVVNLSQQVLGRKVSEESMAQAEPFFIRGQIADVIMTAATQLSDWVPRPDHFFTRGGFVLFEQEAHWQYTIPKFPTIWIDLRALCWLPATDGVLLLVFVNGDHDLDLLGGMHLRFGEAALEDGLVINALQSISPWTEEKVLHMLRDPRYRGLVGTDIWEQTQEKLDEQGEPEVSDVDLLYDDAEALVITMQLSAAVNVLGTLQLFFAQRLIARERSHLPRHELRRLQARNRPIEDVQVITLRRSTSRAYTHEGEAAEVAWSCQWIVGGHWHTYLCGEDRHPEKQWLLPYIKGPDGLPLKVAAERVFDVRR